MLPSIALVGAGPTAIYTLNALVRSATEPCTLTIFEEQEVAGRGTPYRPGWNDPAMLSNIASIEIPPIDRSLVDWLRAQPAERLAALGVEGEIDERAFYPRLALGQFLHDQFEALIARCPSAGISLDLRAGTRVVDAAPDASGFALAVVGPDGVERRERFDSLVVATGHQWPRSGSRPGHLPSPWPASVLNAVEPCCVGVRGASLTAIDASVVLANRFGAFVETDTGLCYKAAPGAGRFRLTLMSRKGLLPEADFYHPIPYEPLAVCTKEAVAREIAAGGAGLLGRVFDLFKREIAAADPDWADRRGIEPLDPEGFAEAYFEERVHADVFEWARANLAEAERNQRDRATVAWRYAILRAHEAVAPAVPHLDEDDYDAFTRHLKPVFVDDYATVPHQSIRRMLALREAGILDVVALADDDEIGFEDGVPGAVLKQAGIETRFDVLVEATGQRPMGADEFPFPSLRANGLIEDSAKSRTDGSGRGVLVDGLFRPIARGRPVEGLYCVALPYILGRHPFVQGITSSRDLGEVVGRELAASVARSRPAQAA